MIVHLELHTRDRAAAAAFYGELFGWRTEEIAGYHALAGLEGGIVQCETRRAGWLPYVGVECVGAKTELARALGATVLLAPREGPAGWRSVVWTAAAGEIALWQGKR